MITDQGSQFGDSCIKVAPAADVEVLRTGVEAHPGLGFGELHYGPSRTTYRQIIKKKANRNKHLALALAQRAMNDTLRPEGLLPLALILLEFVQAHTLSRLCPGRLTL